MGPLLVVHAWVIIAAAMALSIWSLWLLPVSIMLIGARQLGLTILMHDAAHGALHPNAKVNDFVGHWLCGAPMGGHLKAYRQYHLTHHKYAQQAQDPDLILSKPFPVTRTSLRRKIIRDLTRDRPCDITGIEDYAMIDRLGGIQWPFPAGSSKDEVPSANERRLFEDGNYYTSSGKAMILFSPPAELPEPTDAAATEKKEGR
jgi:hypothetical protein